MHKNLAVAAEERTSSLSYVHFRTDVHQISVDLNGSLPGDDFEHGDEDNPLKDPEVGPLEVL